MTEDDSTTLVSWPFEIVGFDWQQFAQKGDMSEEDIASKEAIGESSLNKEDQNLLAALRHDIL